MGKDLRVHLQNTRVNIQVSTSAVSVYIVDFCAMAQVGPEIVCPVTSLHAQYFSKYSP